ncbi:MAG: DUF5666 domain-containing protein [Candidatus Buchananbacteria bacterium]
MKKRLLTTSAVLTLMVLTTPVALAGKDSQNLWAPGQFKNLGLTAKWDGLAGELKSLTSSTAPATLTVNFADQLWTVNLTDTTKLYRRNSTVANLSEFIVGDSLMIRGSLASSTTQTLNALVIKNLSLEKKQTTTNGKILSLGTNSLVIEPKAGQQQTIKLSSNTIYKRGNILTDLASLAVGQQITAKGIWDRQSNSMTASSITIRIITVVKKGEIMALSSTTTPGTLTLKTNQQTYTVNLTANTNLIRKFGGKSNLAEFGIGDQVQVTGILDNDTTITAKSVRDVSIQKRWGNFTGAIESLDSSTQTFSLQPVKRDLQTVKTTLDTKITKAGQTLTFTDLKIADQVIISGVWNTTTNQIMAEKIKVKIATTNDKK